MNCVALLAWCLNFFAGVVWQDDSLVHNAQVRTHVPVMDEKKVLDIVPADSQVVYHIIMYGQSLMLGTQSVPVISTIPSRYAFMFKGGVRVGYDSVDETYYGGLVPLVEKESRSKQTGGALGETPASGCAEEIMKLSLMSNRAMKAGNDSVTPILMFSSPAQGSTSLKDLSEGIYWQRFERDIVEGNRLARQKGLMYNVPVILWNQGEKDIDINTSVEDYKEWMRNLQSKADRFIKSVTRQQNDVRIVMYQTSSHNVRKGAQSPAVAFAQYELSKSEPLISMSGPTYHLPYAKDAVHLTNVGSKWNGAMHGFAIKRLIMDREDWRPVYVREKIVTTNKIELRFHVPVPPLIFDTVAVINPGHFGFRVINDKGDDVVIRQVKILGNSVVISTVEPIPAGSSILYGCNGSGTGAVNGARGNLRDSQGDKSKFKIGTKEYRLDNWTPIFKEAL